MRLTAEMSIRATTIRICGDFQRWNCQQTLPNQSYIDEEVRDSINAGNASSHLLQNILFYGLLSKT
jgi:hypothetical protein